MERLIVPTQLKHQVRNRVANFKNEMSAFLGMPVSIRIQAPTVETTILKTVICHELDLEWADIVSKSRKRTCVAGRQLYSTFCRMFTGKTLKSIADDLNYTDHTDVIHALNTCRDLLDTNHEPLATHYSNIIKTLQHETEA